MRHRFPAESSTQHEQFLARCRKTCFEHAKEVATILDRAIQHGRATLSDTWLPTVAYESTRIMLYQITLENKGIEVSQDVLGDVLPHFKANMKALRLMIPLFAAAKDCVGASCSCFTPHELFHTHLAISSIKLPLVFSGRWDWTRSWLKEQVIKMNQVMVSL